jgi:hypothetical protein
MGSSYLDQMSSSRNSPTVRTVRSIEFFRDAAQGECPDRLVRARAIEMAEATGRITGSSIGHGTD